MSENLFKSEFIQTFNTKGRSSGIGEWTTRNGVKAMDIRPEPFYHNLDDGTVSAFMRGCFATNTSYVIDMWIDTDDVIYNSKNVPGGFTVYYTDGTSEGFYWTGGSKGFQHKRIVTPASKTINLLDSYYYTSIAVYYRWDSYICTKDTEEITKAGLLNTAQIIENSSTASLYEGGSFYCNSINEY